MNQNTRTSIRVQSARPSRLLCQFRLFGSSPECPLDANAQTTFSKCASAFPRRNQCTPFLGNSNNHPPFTSDKNRGGSFFTLNHKQNQITVSRRLGLVSSEKW